MTAGNALLELKTKSQEASFEYRSQTGMRSFFFILALMFTLAFLPIGGIALAFPRQGASPTFSIIITAIGIVSLICAFLVNKDSAKIKSLETAKNSAHTEYWDALTSEMREYGIDTSSMESRSYVNDDSHEFTALRNGVVSDITVRIFGDELVLMMNGEQMIKNTVSDSPAV